MMPITKKCGFGSAESESTRGVSVASMASTYCSRLSDVYKRRQKPYDQCVTAKTKEQVDDNNIMWMMAKLRTFKSSRFGFPRYHMIQVDQIITLSMSTSDDIGTR